MGLLLLLLGNILASLRLFRCFISQKDKAYGKYVMDNNLFDSVMDCFEKNQDRYNMINSAILDIFTHIYHVKKKKKKKKKKKISSNILFIFNNIYRNLMF